MPVFEDQGDYYEVYALYIMPEKKLMAFFINKEPAERFMYQCMLATWNFKSIQIKHILIRLKVEGNAFE